MGTLVEIQLDQNNDRMFTAGFRAINKIAAHMSFHDPDSELSRLNRAPVGEWTLSSPSLRSVLKLGLELGRLTQNRFNLAIAGPMIYAGKLPGAAKNHGWNNLREAGFEVKGRRIRKLSPIQIDLGGIAKGYAVDQAVKAIQKINPRVSGCVNAGGDLFIFGPKSQKIGIRGKPGEHHLSRVIQIQNQALATSVVRSPHPSTAYVDSHKHKFLVSDRHASILASSCMLADALTKVILLTRPTQARRIASHFGAKILSAS
jgi:thiamine biosynthesis lipoprotein